jgi:hypothetical protein
MRLPSSVFVVALIAGATLSAVVNAGEIETQVGASNQSRLEATPHSAKTGSGKKANAMLQDELNQMNRTTKQKQQYRNLENQMKSQQKGLNKQINNQAQAAPLHTAGVAHSAHVQAKPRKRSNKGK